MEIETQDLGSACLVQVTGEVDMSNSPTVRETLIDLTDQKVGAIVVNLEGVTYMDSSGIATLVEGLQEANAYGGKFRLAALTPKVMQVFELARLTDVFEIFPNVELAKEGLSILPQLQESLAVLGRVAIGAAESARSGVDLAKEIFYWMFIGPWRRMRSNIRWESVVEQGVRVGWDAIVIVFVINLFVGMISALQSASLLRQFGQLLLVANAVALSMTRELGPLLTAIIVSGRSGSAFTAEIGSMKMAEEVDALTTMGLNPVRFLMVPRVLAMMIAVPVLTLIADFTGIFGGWLVAVTIVDLGSWQYIRHTMDAIDMGDVMRGLTKSVVFAFLIAMTGCYLGIKVEGGAEGVGRSTTNSVVVSIFLVIFANLIFTAFFYAIE